MSRPSVFINPKFQRGVHINPHFLNAPSPTAPPSSNVHVNPLFLLKSQPVQPAPAAEAPAILNRHKLVRNVNVKSSRPSQVTAVAKPVIVRSRHKLIRQKPKRIVSTPKKVQSNHKKLVLVKINGVTYKSSGTKLHRQVSHTEVPNTNLKRELLRSDKLITLSTGKFIVKHRGQLLQRLPGTPIDPRGAFIEVAGMRFSSTGDGSYRRVAKRKIVTRVKYRRQLKKTNVPCPIFRRLGKCLAHQRGRCLKVHDAKQVILCPSYLRGACTKPTCSLSHEISLSKLPVCRYFLQGICTNESCRYLHKKVSENATICHEFLRGFCPKADQCLLKHEFPSGVRSVKPKIVKPEEETPARYYTELSAEGQRKLEKMLAKVNRLKETQKAYEAAEADTIYLPKVHKILHLEDASPPTVRPPIGPLPSFIPI